MLPWDHLDSGLDKEWLWQDWQDSLAEFEQDDCRWTPCFDCGVCPSMDTEIQIGPTGRKLLPLTPGRRGLRSRPGRQQPRAARRRWCSGSACGTPSAGPLRFTSHRDFARAFERALRRARVPIAYSQGFTPHPKISYASAAPTGVASEAEYLEIGLQAPSRPGGAERGARRGAVAGSGRARRGGGHAGHQPGRPDRRLRAWRMELPGGRVRRAGTGGGGVPGGATRFWSNG